MACFNEFIVFVAENASKKFVDNFSCCLVTSVVIHVYYLHWRPQGIAVFFFRHTIKSSLKKHKTVNNVQLFFNVMLLFIQ